MTTLARRPAPTTRTIARRHVERPPSQRAAAAARAVAVAYLEIRAGRRPPTCLDDHATAVVVDHLRRLARQDDRAAVSTTDVVRTRITRIDRGVDAIVMVRQDGRVCVVAMRLEIRDHHWTIVHLGTPEDHARSQLLSDHDTF